MADIFNNEKRSEIMRKVKSKKNKSTELRLIDIFKQNGITAVSYTHLTLPTT